MRKFILINFSINDKMTGCYLLAKMAACSFLKKILMLALKPKPKNHNVTSEDSTSDLVTHQAQTFLYGFSSLIFFKLHMFQLFGRLIMVLFRAVYKLVASLLLSLAKIATLTGEFV